MADDMDEVRRGEKGKGGRRGRGVERAGCGTTFFVCSPFPAPKVRKLEGTPEGTPVSENACGFVGRELLGSKHIAGSQGWRRCWKANGGLSLHAGAACGYLLVQGVAAKQSQSPKTHDHIFIKDIFMTFSFLT